jgi:hypothetical protein
MVVAHILIQILDNLYYAIFQYFTVNAILKFHIEDGREMQRPILTITCQCGNAWQCGRGHWPFQWQHGNFDRPVNPNLPQWLRWNLAELMSLRSFDMPKVVEVGRKMTPARIRDIQVPPFFSICFFVCIHPVSQARAQSKRDVLEICKMA